MKKLLLILLITLSASADAVDEVRQAEIGFAKAFADRDAAKFFSFVADDATFLGPSTLKGKEAVVKGWSPLLAGKDAPFSWTPERVSVNASETIGLSTGPVFGANGKHGGTYSSIWVKQPDGAWKVLFDNGAGAACLVETALPTTEGFVTTEDGVKLHYRKVGQGPTLIIPLGFALHDDFKSLADVATVITYDPRNRGRSSRVENTSSLTIENDVRDLEAVRQQLRVERFIPVGYSYLGLVVAMYAAEHPERVTRIIQLSPAPRKFDQPASVAKTSQPCEAEWETTRLNLVGDPKHASRVTVPCKLENEWPVNLARFPPQKADFSLSSAQSIKVPVLVIHGTSDRNVAYAAGREWASTLPNARLVTVPDGGHASWLDNGPLVFASIREFVRGNWPRASDDVK